MKFIFILFGLLISFSSYADEVLYCSSELGTGFYNESGSWQSSANLKPERFSVKVIENFASIQIGDAVHNCSVFFVKDNRAYICNNEFAGMDTGISFRYYPQTKRYIRISSSFYGYLNNESNFGEVFSAGVCEKF